MEKYFPQALRSHTKNFKIWKQKLQLLENATIAIPCGDSLRSSSESGGLEFSS